MATLNLSNQETIKNQIGPKIQILKDSMDLRKSVWNKISTGKRKKWIQADKDPLMSLAWSIYKYLRNNFFGSETDEYL